MKKTLTLALGILALLAMTACAPHFHGHPGPQWDGQPSHNHGYCRHGW